jgi:hypothetical protein
VAKKTVRMRRCPVCGNKASALHVIEGDWRVGCNRPASRNHVLVVYAGYLAVAAKRWNAIVTGRKIKKVRVVKVKAAPRRVTPGAIRKFRT